MKTNLNIKWPKRAVVTAGMPYGNKELHFGHVGGVFVPADCFARFLKDRIGKDNVLFISGTDCFGSPIDEGFRKLKEAGNFDGTILDYVNKNHLLQENTLRTFDVELSIFEGSGIGECGQIHQKLTEEIIQTLKENGWLKLKKSYQFYDPEAKMFLNGRQVNGRCPVQGCKSENAYADECSMGHQYAPNDLIAPISSVTSTVPELREVKNWYFDLPKFRKFLTDQCSNMRKDDSVREIVPRNISEFLLAPIIYVKNEYYDQYKALRDNLPKHLYAAAQDNKQSFTLEFSNVDQRDKAKDFLTKSNIRFRTGKTLVPFRITGNASWGVCAPKLDDNNEHVDMTVWCWPESLWAPISFTMAALNKMGKDDNEWKKYWCDSDSQVYQFIGQDNIYFYGVAQPCLFEALQVDLDGKKVDNSFNGLQQSNLVANHHVLFGKLKASSSSKFKVPTADKLLDFYTSEQLRAHWLALGLAQKSVGFCPKVFEVDEKKKSDPRYADPVLKEGTLLTNVFNRLARSCFYEATNNFDCKIELLNPCNEVLESVKDALHEYEHLMYKVELYSVMQLMDRFIRFSNKWWADGIAKVSKEELAQNIDVRSGDKPTAARAKILAESFYLLYACILMMHPIVPRGCNSICRYMNFEPDKIFNWDNIYLGLQNDSAWSGITTESVHEVVKLEPRSDFFKKHDSQYKKR